jgi:hypothetical protein
MKFLALIGAFVLVVAAIVVTPTLASGPVDIVVEDNSAPVEGTTVLVRHTAGEISAVTDEQGIATVQIPGKHFRLVVDGVAQPGAYTTDQGTITVDISNP